MMLALFHEKYLSLFVAVQHLMLKDRLLLHLPQIGQDLFLTG
jgi:hypothetical protein